MTYHIKLFSCHCYLKTAVTVANNTNENKQETVPLQIGDDVNSEIPVLTSKVNGRQHKTLYSCPGIFNLVSGFQIPGQLHLIEFSCALCCFFSALLWATAEVGLFNFLCAAYSFN
ncbi:hypothetical protein ATANTOWER_005184 [Ataeniobius toweri]|uniref:Uncharacterized protein n=1 Tax=Ataeniobius toweri TaxID=208326 RepID=A0ABU7BQZ7_9TELE|nr:hypothetical protein [Ataeniobius toweri]